MFGFWHFRFWCNLIATQPHTVFIFSVIIIPEYWNLDLFHNDWSSEGLQKQKAYGQRLDFIAAELIGWAADRIPLASLLLSHSSVCPNFPFSLIFCLFVICYSLRFSLWPPFTIVSTFLFSSKAINAFLLHNAPEVNQLAWNCLNNNFHWKLAAET